jgi:CheY-like chemotaxis protein
VKDSFSILLAEDDPNDVFFLKRAFKEAGIEHPLHVAIDGQAAMDYLSGANGFSDRKRYPMPGLLILDLKMPRRTGMDVLRWLRSQPVLDCLPVIILSSSAQRYDVERAYKLGVNAFVVKPGDLEQRANLARYIKGFWLQFNYPPLLCSEGLEAARQFHVEFPEPPAGVV